MEKTLLCKAVNSYLIICLFCLLSFNTNAQLAVYYNEPMSELYVTEKSETGEKHLDTIVFLNMNREHSFQIHDFHLFASYATVTSMTHKTYVIESYLINNGKMKLTSQTLIHLNKYPVLSSNKMRVTMKDVGICLNFDSDNISMIVLPYLILNDKNKFFNTLKKVQHLYEMDKKNKIILK